MARNNHLWASPDMTQRAHLPWKVSYSAIWVLKSRVDSINSSVLPGLQGLWIQDEVCNPPKDPPQPLSFLSLIRIYSQPHPSIATWIARKEGCHIEPLGLAHSCAPCLFAQLLWNLAHLSWSSPVLVLTCPGPLQHSAWLQGWTNWDNEGMNTRQTPTQKRWHLLLLRAPTASLNKAEPQHVYFLCLNWGGEFIVHTEQGGWFS